MNENENHVERELPGGDPYALSAEYIDIMIAETWEGLAPEVVSVLKGLHATEGPVVDLGAGSGRGVRAVREALPGAPVLAVEPSPAMRAVLLARVHDEPLLRTGVTVLPADASSAELPDGMRAVLAMNVLGHLSPDQRRTLWGKAARRLAPGGALLVNVTPPFTPQPVPRTRMAHLTLGDLTYEGWAQAEPAGHDQVVWRMDYRVARGTHQVSQVSVDYRWWVMGDDALADEVAVEGLVLRPMGGSELGLRVLTRVGE
ncbi:class I SAM-dependent methyltransferase [Streptomyces jeddahensis]|uniref:Methyltransferase domain protein n=1 Tax=Streptomyces jeddahensis TaxID=1716141 RepID=A0A177HP95_9ACTN|nr:class I SAM-dependent methyltransferase [Streptomyces jeddahensis]OAH12832.1 methyltransferase domain protein [Streptomyces jeddahensis]